MKNLIFTGAVAAALCSTLPQAADAAGLLFSFLEKTGGGIELTMSGSINTDAVSGNLVPVRADCGYLDAICLGTYAESDGAFDMDQISFTVLGFSFPIRDLSIASWQEGTGDYVELFASSSGFALRSDYVSGTELSGTAFLPGATFESFGISKLEPEFCQIAPLECRPIAVLGGSDTSNTLTFELLYEADLAAVPLPATLPLMLAGLGALALGRRRSARRY